MAIAQPTLASFVKIYLLALLVNLFYPTIVVYW